MKLLLCFALLAAVATVHTLPSGDKKNTYRAVATKNEGNAGIAVGEPHPDNDVKDQGDNKRKMYNVQSLSKGVQFDRKQTAKICLGEDSDMYVMIHKTMKECKKEVGLNKQEQKDDMDSSEEEEDKEEEEDDDDRMEGEERKGQGKQKQDPVNKKMSMCERKEHMIMKMKMRKCMMDKMEWVDKDGMADMEKIQSSYAGTKMEDIFMKKGDKTINKCAQIAIANTAEVEKKLMKIMNVEMCQRDLGAEKESSEEYSSPSEKKDVVRAQSWAKKAAKKENTSKSLGQGKGMKDTYVMDQDLVKEMMEMSKIDLVKQVLRGISSNCINKAYLRICKAYMMDILLSEEEMSMDDDAGTDGGKKKKNMKLG